MKIFNILITIGLFMLVVLDSSLALPVAEVPDPLSTSGKMVQDSAKVLSAEYIKHIDALCKNLQEQSGAQLAVVTVDNLNGNPVEDYATALFNLWGIGDDERDDGVLILFSHQDRKVRVELGYGIEPIITDAQAGRYIREIAIPEFKKQQYGRGLYLLARAVAEQIAASKEKDLKHQAPAPLPVENMAVMRSANPAASHHKRGDYTALSFLFGVVLVGYVCLMTVLFLMRMTVAKARAEKIKIAEKTRFGAMGLWITGIGGYIGLLVTFDKGILSFFIMFVIFVVSLPLQMLLRQRMLARAKTYTPLCKACRTPMRLLTEKEDNRFLTPSEIAEEKVRGMDYEFWVCDLCKKQTRYNIRLDGANRCKKCKKYTLLHHEHVLKKATTSHSGKMQKKSICANPECDYESVYTYNIPRLGRSGTGCRSSCSGFSSSGGFSSGGSWGGGSSGGGGASGGW